MIVCKLRVKSGKARRTMVTCNVPEENLSLCSAVGQNPDMMNKRNIDDKPEQASKIF